MMIEIKNLSKTYKGADGDNVVLDNLSFEIEPHKTTVIMGDSGFGKTTLLRILMGLEKADSGEVTGMAKSIGAVFQEDRLCEDFSAVSNIKMTAPKTVSIKDIEENLAKVGLGDSLHKAVREFSGGMKRRVAIVRAIMSGRDIIILDEPIKGLDAANKENVLEYIKNNTRGKTVIMVTHNIAEAEFMGDKIIKLEDL